MTKVEKKRSKYFWAYTRIFLTIASGATPTGSASRSPDEGEITNFAWKREIIEYIVEQIIDFIVNRSTLDVDIRWFTPIGRDLRLAEENNPKILGIETAKQGSH
jgi:hypothetical protein